MTPNADGPDFAVRYQEIIGPAPGTWSLCSTKWCEGQQSEHAGGLWRAAWRWMREQSRLRYRGGFHWLRSDSTPKAQADFALRLMKKHEFGVSGDVWQVDWETTPRIRPLLAAEVAEYNDRVRQGLGEDRLIIYCSDWVPNFVEWRNDHPDDALWYANYNLSDSENGGWKEAARYNAAVWQWTSTYPNNDCIRSYNSPGFDMNHILNRTILDRIAKIEVVQPPPEPDPDPVPPKEYAVTVNLPRLDRSTARGDLHVVKLQRLLDIADDGWYGPQTERAVKDWQKRHKLVVDGWVGGQTWSSVLTER